MNKALSRTEMLFGNDALKKLKDAHVLIAGLGGVGGAAAEVLARTGVGHLTLVDHDIIEASNINRQIIANQKTIGLFKTECFFHRLSELNDIEVKIITKKITMDNINEFITGKIDYLIDAIDSLDDKASLIAFCQAKQINFISSMGMAFKKDPTQVKIIKMNQTINDPLAKALRNKLRKLNCSLDFDVVSSSEKPSEKPNALASYIGVTFAAGIYLADYVIKSLMK